MNVKADVEGPRVFDADPAKWRMVPANVKRRFLALLDEKAERHAVASSVMRQLELTREQLGRGEAQLAERDAVTRPQFWPEETKNNPPSWRVEMLAEIETLKATKDRLAARYEQASSAWSAVARPCDRIEYYLRENLGNLRETSKLPKPEMRKGEQPIDAVERLRRGVRELRDDYAATLAAPLPAALAQARVSAQVDTLIESGRPNVVEVVEHRMLDAVFPMKLLPSMDYGGASVSVPAVDPVALLAWIFPDQLKAALMREVIEVADDDAALTDEARAERLRAIAGELLIVEREEVAHCESIGLPLRDDVDPRAALGLSDDMPVPKDF